MLWMNAVASESRIIVSNVQVNSLGLLQQVPEK
jgi:hypothetical protein